MSAMSELDARLRELGTPYFDGDEDVWVEVEPDGFRFAVITVTGELFRLGESLLTRAQIESDCGELRPY